MKELIKQYKEDLKALAVLIRLQKGTRKEHKNGYVPGLWGNQYNYRIKHIAYCLMRGRKYEQIEQPKRNLLSRYDWRKIEELQKVEVKKNEDVCISAG